MTYLYHNHYHEFYTINGKTVMDLMMENTDPDYLSLELDTFWVMRAGLDPVEQLKHFGKRVKLLHQKDFAWDSMEPLNMRGLTPEECTMPPEGAGTDGNSFYAKTGGHAEPDEAAKKARRIRNTAFTEIGMGIMHIQDIIDAANAYTEAEYIILEQDATRLEKLFCSCTYITNAECEDGFQLHLAFESGITVDIEVGTCHFISEPMWCIYGDQGSAVIHNFRLEGKMICLTSWDDKDVEPIAAGAGLTKTMAPRSVGESVEERPLPRFDFDRNTLYRNFAEVCQGTAEQIVTQEHALRVLHLMEACFRSAKSGEAVMFEG